MSYDLDPNLEQYASKRQWEYLTALEKHDTHRGAAKILGVTHNNIWQAKRDVLRKARKAGFFPELTHPMPEGLKLRGTTTLYDSDGMLKHQYVKTEPDKARQQEMFMAAIDALSCDLPRVERIGGPASTSDLLAACYPCGDHHLGMLAHGEETNNHRDGNYNIKIAEKLLCGATDYLLRRDEPCDNALIAFLGDFMHYDSMVPETPTGHNKLDADGRFHRMVQASIRCMRYMIERTAERHGRVDVIVEIGNHDLSSSIFLMECLSNIYDKNPRIRIDTSPAHYHYYEYGKNLIGTHHGHGRKLPDLPLVMAIDEPGAWARCPHRAWWTGHIHSHHTHDVQGISVESFRVLGPNDAWAAQKGYRSSRDMTSIMLHREYGMYSRSYVRPSMLEN